MKFRAKNDLRRFLAIGGLLLWQSGVSEAAQDQPTPEQSTVQAQTFRIAGTVLNSITGEPLSEAKVSLADTKNRQEKISMTTTESGHFEFSSLSPGKYSLEGAKRGFITAGYEQHEQFSTAIVTGLEFLTEGLRLRLTPTALISGHVTDEFGQPIRSARVGLYLESHNGGMNRIVRAGNSTTDDRGFFDFSQLHPGKYFVSVIAEPWYAIHPRTALAGESAYSGDSAVSASLDVVYPTTYYGGSREAEGATAIELKGGDKLQIDVHLHPERALRMIIRVPQVEEEEPNRSISVTLQKHVFDSMDFVQSNLRALAPGVFEIVGLAPGRYTVRTHDGQTGQMGIATDVELLTNNQELDASHSEPLGRLQLTLKMPDDEPVTKLRGVVLQDSSRHVVAFRQTDPTGQLSFEDLLPGKYAILINSSGRRYAVMKITSSEGEYASHEVNITPGAAVEVSARVSAGIVNIEGVVHKKDKVVAGVMVVLVPKDPETHVEFFRRDQSALDGSFILQSVIPGSYTIIAVEDAWGFDWLKPGVLAKYAKQGQDLTVGELMRGVVHLPDPVEVQGR